MLEDRVLKLERGREVATTPSGVAPRGIAPRPAATVKRLPDGRELPVYKVGPEDGDPSLATPTGTQTEAQGGSTPLQPLAHEELDDPRLWEDPTGFAAEDDESSKKYRLVGKNLVRLTEPDKPKAPDRAPAGKRGRSLKAQYASALELYRAAAFAEAESAFQSIATAFPRSDYADNAYYWMGESAYDQEHFSDALAAFTAVVERYGGGNKAPDALLKIGLCYSKLGDSANARDVLSQLVAAYPGARASDIARARLAELES